MVENRISIRSGQRTPAHPSVLRRQRIQAVLDERSDAPPRERRRHESMRASLRIQAIEAFVRETGQPITDPVVRKIRLRPEIELIATVNGQSHEMRWSYADGALTRIP